MTTQEILARAKKAAPRVSGMGENEKNKALLAMADALVAGADGILSVNAEEVAAARASLGAVMIDRLSLSRERIAAMADGIRQVAALPDPAGRVLSEETRPNGLRIKRISVPLGVVGMIYESRPNVTADAAALCFKSGNACVLKAGREAHKTALAIAKCLKDALAPFGAEEAVWVLEDKSRGAASALMGAVGYIDVLIPRGGAGLIRACTENAKVPCIETGTGICHVYVDRAADLGMAVNILYNAKTSRPSVCNAAEVCLVHRDVAAEFLPMIQAKLVDERRAAGLVPVELRLDGTAAAYIAGSAAGEADFDTEFLDYILAVRVVDSLDEAIAHIAAHSTRHSEAIVTRDGAAAERFARLVDSAAVYVNASTRFTDGGEFGLGCEIGISTQKLHARGPMGLFALTSTKFVIEGEGQVRA